MKGYEGWRKVQNEEHHNLYSSPSKIRMAKSRKMIWAGLKRNANAYNRILVAKPEGKRPLGRIFVNKLEGKRPLGRPRNRWVDNIEMNLDRDRERENGGGIDRTDLANDRDQWKTYERGNKPSGYTNCW
jgi:hypothetical protein